MVADLVPIVTAFLLEMDVKVHGEFNGASIGFVD
jgi:hypothetical protein